MNQEDLDWTAVTSRAEQILSTQFSQVERFSDDGRRNLLLRCTLENPANADQKSVIIKQMLPFNDDPDEIRRHDLPRFWRDWAGAELLTAVNLLSALQKLWPEPDPLPMYPAFREGETAHEP